MAHRGNGRPRVHARDHEHGGADTTLIHYEDVGDPGAGAGIRFDTVPQEGGNLLVETTDIYMDLENHGSGVFSIVSDGGGGLTVHSTTNLQLRGDDGAQLLGAGGGGVLISAGAGGAHVLISDLPTSDPHVTNALWNSSGTLKISAG